jgi:uncharacterized membrane protein
VSVDAAFEQIRHYSRADLAVNLRMLRALSEVAGTIRDSAVQKVARRAEADGYRLAAE